MKKITVGQVENFLATQEAKDAKLVLAFIVDKTPTQVDDNIIAQAADYTEQIEELLSSVDELDPTAVEALQAGLRLLQKIASLTETKWDDFIIGLAGKITGANKKE